MCRSNIYRTCENGSGWTRKQILSWLCSTKNDVSLALMTIEAVAPDLRITESLGTLT